MSDSDLSEEEIAALINTLTEKIYQLKTQDCDNELRLEAKNRRIAVLEKKCLELHNEYKLMSKRVSTYEGDKSIKNGMRNALMMIGKSLPDDYRNKSSNVIFKSEEDEIHRFLNQLK